MIKKTGQVTSPLHGGKAPHWLFDRMRMLSRYVVLALREDFGAGAILEKLADPYWFQCLGCVLGFDWHSSGLTTTVCGALKEAVRGIEMDTGLFVAGGKGKASRRTPEEIARWSEASGAPGESLVYASRMSAKVDSAAVQDGYQLYHHTFFFTSGGQWAVVQQGMNEESRTARRYHWLGEKVERFVCEPHSGIAADRIHQRVLNLVAKESEECRKASVLIAGTPPARWEEAARGGKFLLLPTRHDVRMEDIDSKRVVKILLRTYESAPKDFEQLLALPGVGGKSLRALALLSELLYGKPPSFADPARFSYAHGGKDGTPYPVDRKVYDATIAALKRAVESSRLGNRDKLTAMRTLASFYEV
jgi:hypothetical protein